jgi:hypothetical protein
MTDDIVSAALELGAKGFSVFPITTNSKIPNLKKWNEKASRNPEDIKEMFLATTSQTSLFTARHSKTAT